MSNLSKPLCSLRHGISSQFQLLQHFDYGVRAVFKGVNCLLFLLSLVVFILPKNSFGQCNILGTPLTITGAVTWNTSNTIYTNVIVSAGATLTISGSGTLIKMCPDAQIFVKANAKIIIKDYAEVTCLISSSSDFWKGVLVEGDITHSQETVGGYCYQGQFEMLNHGVISFAKTAVNVSNVFLVPGIGSGGIVITKNGHFVNCMDGISMGPYLAPMLAPSPNNKSRIELTEFRWDVGLYQHPTIGYFGILTSGIRGMNIRGCQFTSGLPLGYVNQVVGITLINSQVSVIPFCHSLSYPCTLETPCDFQSLGVGVNIYYSQSLYPTVDKCNMTDCIYGVLNTAGFFTRISRNNMSMYDFNIAEYYKTAPGYNPIDGIFNSDVFGYSIEQNHIQFGPNSDWHRGIVNEAFMSLQADEYVYNNTIEGINNSEAVYQCGALWAKGLNNNTYYDALVKHYVVPENFKGLQYLCNHLIDNNTHIAIEDSTGIRVVQGSVLAETGNRFYNSTSVHTEIDNQTFSAFNPLGHFIYYSNSSIANSWPTVITPLGSVQVYDETPLNKCPLNFVDEVDHDPGPHGKMRFTDTLQAKLDYFAAVDHFAEINSTLDQLVDNGNSSDLLALIGSSSEPEENQALYQILSSISPFLSDKSIKYAVELNLFTHEEYLNLFISNPEICALPSFIYLLESTELNFDSSELQSILEHQFDVTERGTMRSDRDSISFEMDQLLRKLIQTIKYDEFASAERFEELFDRYPDFGFIYALTESFLHRNRADLAEVKLEQFLAVHRFEGDELTNLLDYTSLFNILKVAYSDSRSVFALNDEELLAIDEIAQRPHSYGQHLAHTIYCKIYNKCSFQDEDFLFPRQRKDDLTLTLAISPNPSGDLVTIKLPTYEIGEKVKLEIINLNGSVYYDTYQLGEPLNISFLKSGFYILRCSQNSGSISLGKLCKL